MPKHVEYEFKIKLKGTRRDANKVHSIAADAVEQFCQEERLDLRPIVTEPVRAKRRP